MAAAAGILVPQQHHVAQDQQITCLVQELKNAKDSHSQLNVMGVPLRAKYYRSYVLIAPVKVK